MTVPRPVKVSLFFLTALVQVGVAKVTYVFLSALNEMLTRFQLYLSGATARFVETHLF